VKHRLAALALSLVVIAGLVHASVLPASACACVPLTQNGALQTVLSQNDGLIVEGALAPSDPADPSWSRRFNVDTVYFGDAPPQIVLAMREPSVIEPFDPTGYLDSTAPDCTYIILGQTGERYLLFLRADASGAYEPLGCDSFAIQDEARDSYYAQLRAAIRNGTDAHPPDTTIVNPTLAPTLPIIPSKGTPIPGSDSRPPSEYLRASTTEPPAAANAATAGETSGDKDVPWQILLPGAFIIPIAVLLCFSFFVRRRGGGH
jgi:hypothetical protein